MKSIDPKSVLIGVLATALVIACTDSSKPTSIIPEAKAAAGVNDKWDDKQEWLVSATVVDGTAGWEPLGYRCCAATQGFVWRKRIK